MSCDNDGGGERVAGAVEQRISTYASFLLLGGDVAGDIGKVLDDLFGVLGLTGTRLTTLVEHFKK